MVFTTRGSHPRGRFAICDVAICYADLRCLLAPGVCVCGFLSFCIDHTKWLYFVATGESEARAYESRSDAGAGSSKESFGEELYRSNKHEQDHPLPPGDLRNSLAPGERGSCSVQSTTMGAFLPLL